MPIYEYKCLDCGKLNEFLLLSNKEEKLTCKYCGSERLEKVPSFATFLKANNRKGRTCCGREERCSSPPCAGDGTCKRH